MSYKRRLSKLENEGGEYQRLKEKFFFYLPIIESPEGELLNAPPEEDRQEFEKFITMAKAKGEIFNPLEL